MQKYKILTPQCISSSRTKCVWSCPRQASVNTEEERAEKNVKSWRVWRSGVKMLASGHNIAIANMSSWQLWLPAINQTSLKKNAIIDGGSEYETPPLPEELLSVDGCLPIGTLPPRKVIIPFLAAITCH